MPEALLKEYLRSLREDHASGEAAVEVSGMGRCRRSSTLPGSASPRAYAPDAPLTRQVAGKLAVALKTDRHDLAVAENVSYMSRLAVGGKLSRKVAAGVAAHLIENEPDSEAGRRLTEAALEELVRMTEVAAETQRVVALTSRERNWHGRRINNPLSSKKEEFST